MSFLISFNLLSNYLSCSVKFKVKAILDPITSSAFIERLFLGSLKLIKLFAWDFALFILVAYDFVCTRNVHTEALELLIFQC